MTAYHKHNSWFEILHLSDLRCIGITVLSNTSSTGWHCIANLQPIPWLAGFMILVSQLH
jgi:hypothetical protein